MLIKWLVSGHGLFICRRKMHPDRNYNERRNISQMVIKCDVVSSNQVRAMLFRDKWHWFYSVHILRIPGVSERWMPAYAQFILHQHNPRILRHKRNDLVNHHLCQ